jgi:Domain of unknown function (DUF6916)
MWFALDIALCKVEARTEPWHAMLDKLSHDDFLKCLHERFEIRHGGETIKLQLIECRTLPSSQKKDSERKPFGVIFRGPRAPVLAQRIYRLEGTSIGTLEIFIVPVGPDAEGMRYEAIFS